MVPDLLAYWLSGELANERTNASTTGLLDARSGEWSHELIERLGLPARPFGALVDPGTALGPVRADHELGAATVYAVASHDTASAFAAAPLRDEHCAILSSGTWSLLGVETQTAVPRPRRLRRQPDQRARDRRHDAAAQERHRPVARAGVRAHVGRRSRRAVRRRRRRRPDRRRCSTPTTSR